MFRPRFHPSSEFEVELIAGPLAGQKRTVVLPLELARIGVRGRWAVAPQVGELSSKGWPWEVVKSKTCIYEFIRVNGTKLVAEYRGA